MVLPTLEELRGRLAGGPPYDEDLLQALRRDGRAGARALHERCMRRLSRGREEEERMALMWALEEEAHGLGFGRVAAVDEAGRGPLAGPIAAGAVVLAGPVAGVNDSKLLSEGQREALFERLSGGEHDIGVALIGPETIDRIGIQQANYCAMAQAVAALGGSPDFVLVDGRVDVPGLAPPQRHVVKGDRRSMSIAAASIVAKVTRDRVMDVLDREYPEYGFGSHKGYGTMEHMAALARFGPCPAHRRSFAPLSVSRETAPLSFEGPCAGENEKVE